MADDRVAAQQPAVVEVERGDRDDLVAVDELAAARRPRSRGRRRRRSASPTSAPCGDAPRACSSSGCVEPQPVVDVRAVGCGVQHVDVGAERAQRRGRGSERGAVPAVEHDVQPVEAAALERRRRGARRSRRARRGARSRPRRRVPVGPGLGHRSVASARSSSSTRASSGSGSLRPPGGEQLDAVVGRTGCGWRRSPPRRAPRSCARNATPGVGQHAGEHDVGTLGAEARRRARLRASGPERRVSRPTTNGCSAPSTRAAARPSAVTSSAVSSAFASPRTPSVPKRRVMATRSQRAHRFEYCGALRAFLRPYLRRSFSRASRVRSPAFLSCGRASSVERDERAGDAEAERAGLAAHAAAVERRVDVVDLVGLREPQRLLRDRPGG